MIVGNIGKFAIESFMSCADVNVSIRGIGFFLIHIQDVVYGLKSDDATALACSFDEVKNRIGSRGMHTAPFSKEKPDEIALNFRKALYEDGYENECFFELTNSQFSDLIYNNNLLWAPDGDAAFNDGSYVLQFDVNSMVRLIGFKSSENNSIDMSTLTDLWICGDEFYNILSNWHNSYELEWIDLTK